ncbi:porin family protein [Mucilaginibacter lutimaris]|uniref:Porin family protein n=1 Tax=Mucilaginibacter lutimaris TaxID=931629 RepID=A0ABW2ZD88_9SPHI
MKKLLLIAVVLMSASLASYAQLPTFGIKGGVNFATLNASASSAGTSVSVTTGTLTTFSAGVFADFKLGGISLQPALNFTGKGGKQEEDGNVAKINLYYLQLPVNIVYHAPVAIGNVYFGAGPYAALGVTGKQKYTGGGVTQSEDITFGSDAGDVKRTDFGINGIAGVEFKNGFLVGLNYDLGLSDIGNDGTSQASTKNRVFGVSVGFKF